MVNLESNQVLSISPMTTMMGISIDCHRKTILRLETLDLKSRGKAAMVKVGGFPILCPKLSLVG
jgi:hypothetical protein